MTSTELVAYFNSNFGLSKEWPKEYYVDAETYGYVSYAVHEWAVKRRAVEFGGYISKPSYQDINILLGANGGLMFKGVEIILK